jgi:hypothetical protein
MFARIYAVLGAPPRSDRNIKGIVALSHSSFAAGLAEKAT